MEQLMSLGLEESTEKGRPYISRAASPCGTGEE